MHTVNATGTGQRRGAALRSVGAVLASVAFLLTGHGLQLTLLPIRGALEGFSQLEIGLLGSVYFGGYVLGCIVAPRIMIRAGHARTFAALIALAVCAALVHAMIVTPLVWMGARAITGFCLAGLYLIVESWLNERAENETRGTIMATYVTVNLMMLTVGQMMVTLFDPLSFVQFSMAAIAISLAAIPIVLTASQQPAPVTLVRFRPRALFALSPAGFVAIFLIGMSNGAFWALGPSFGQLIGLSITETALFMSAAVFGGAVLQFPIGRLSDRVDRRYVMIGLALASIVLGILLSGYTPLGPESRQVVAFLFGAAILPAYTVAAAHAYDFARKEGYVEVSAGLLLLFGLGSILGPLPASALMELVRPGALFLFMAAANAVLASYVLFRVLCRAPVPRAEKEDYSLGNVAPVVVVADSPAFEQSPLVVDPSAPAEAPPEREPLSQDATTGEAAETVR